MVLIVWSKLDVVCAVASLQCLGLGGNGLRSPSCGCPLTTSVEFRVHFKILELWTVMCSNWLPCDCLSEVLTVLGLSGMSKKLNGFLYFLLG